MPTTTTVRPAAPAPTLSRLSDRQLLADTRELARRERWLNTQIIDHLREIGARGLHLRAGYSGLFDYAVSELGFGEGSAYQRIQAMKLCTEYPEVTRDLQEGELTLTAAGYLQSAFDRHARQQRKRAREQHGGVASDRAAGDVRGVGAGGETGGTPGNGAAAESAWALGAGGEEQAGALPSGVDREAVGGRQSGGAGEAAPTAAGSVGAVGAVVSMADEGGLTDSVKRELIARARGKSTRQVNEMIAHLDPELARPRERLRALGKDRWEIKAVIDGQCRSGVEQLRHWLSHINPAMEFGELLQRLVADGVAKYDPARQPKRAGKRCGAAKPKAPKPIASAAPTGDVQFPLPTVAAARAAAGDPAFAQKCSTLSAPSRPPGSGGKAGRRPRATVTRIIPAAVKRHIWLRDQGRCTYRDPDTGRRCGSRHLVQIDHVQPYAVGGGAEPDNLRLLCSAHNRARSARHQAGPEEGRRRRRGEGIGPRSGAKARATVGTVMRVSGAAASAGLPGARPRCSLPPESQARQGEARCRRRCE